MDLQSYMESLATPEDVCQDFSGVKLPFYLKDDFTRQNVNYSLLSACGAQLSHLDAIAGSVGSDIDVMLRSRFRATVGPKL